MLERFFSRAERKKLFLSWAGSASMWIKVIKISQRTHSVSETPVGRRCNLGNAGFAPDDQSDSIHTHGELIAFRESQMLSADNDGVGNMTSEQAGTWILQHTPATFQVRISRLLISQCTESPKENDGNQLFRRN